MRSVGFAGLALLAMTGSAAAEYAPKICEDAGGFIVADQPLTFEDIAVEGVDAVNLNEKGPITAYGYVVQIKMGSGLTEPVSFKIGAITDCYPSMRTLLLDGSTLLEVVVARSSFKTDDEWKMARRNLLRADGGYLTPIALVKVVGQFALSNRDSLLLDAKSVDVVESWK